MRAEYAGSVQIAKQAAPIVLNALADHSAHAHSGRDSVWRSDISERRAFGNRGAMRILSNAILVDRSKWETWPGLLRGSPASAGSSPGCLPEIEVHAARCAPRSACLPAIMCGAALPPYAPPSGRKGDPTDFFILHPPGLPPPSIATV